MGVAARFLRSWPSCSGGEGGLTPQFPRAELGTFAIHRLALDNP